MGPTVGMSGAVSEWGLSVWVSCGGTGLREGAGHRVPEPTLPEQPLEQEQEQQPEPGQFSLGDIREVKAQSRATVTLRGTCPPVPTLLCGPRREGQARRRRRRGWASPLPRAGC